METQLKKGALALCVLATLAHRDCYGYELVSHISRHIQITEGTMYPLLRRLSREGLTETYLKESTEGPARKYYRLTEAGTRKLNALRTQWQAFITGVNQILGERHESE